MQSRLVVLKLRGGLRRHRNVSPPRRFRGLWGGPDWAGRVDAYIGQSSDVPAERAASG
jgi:hypothetical protein